LRSKDIQGFRKNRPSNAFLYINHRKTRFLKEFICVIFERNKLEILCEY